jgi:two-component system heavy metal sensor histidine kinase CusS
MPSAAAPPDSLPGKPAPDPQTYALSVAAIIRLAAGTALLGVATGLTVNRRFGYVTLLVPMLAYVVLATVALISRRRALGRALALLMPFVDLSFAFVLHRHGMDSFRIFAASWATSSLGVFTLIVALVGLTLPVRLVVVVTALALVAEWLILRDPGITLYSVVVATSTIVFTAIATSTIPRIAMASLRREEQAARTLDALAQARAQNRQLELLQREKDTLLEIIVHDMRSPVGAAMLSLEYLILELKKQPNQAALLEATDDAAATLNSLSNMISQILDTSKLENGRITLRLDRAELRPLLENTQREIVPRAAGRAIAVRLEAAEGLQAAVDLRLFPRALETLATHLLRHTPESGRMLLVATGNADEVRVSLHSTAPAIPTAERERIFEKFPVSEGELRRLPGWGLGLYFCRLVASAHQGSVAVEDVDGWPTSFVVRLPALPRST